MGESRKYRKFTAQQKTELVLASLRGPETIARLCRRARHLETLLRRWREQFLAAGAERLSGKAERTESDELPAGQSPRAGVGPQDDGGGGRGGTLAGMGVSVRAARSERAGRARPSRRPGRPRRRNQPPGDLPTPEAAAKGVRRPLDAVDRVVLGVARENPTDGTRMVAALASREGASPVNRKRVQRLMREHRLLQPARSEGRRHGPGYFQVTRPDELWHLDMTSVWVAEHGWCYLNAAIDCCTREITGWALDIRCRAAEAIAVVERAVADRDVSSRAH